MSGKKEDKKKRARRRVRKPGSLRDTAEKKAEADLLKKGKTKEGTKPIASFFQSLPNQQSVQIQAPPSAQIQAQPNA